MNEKRKYIFGPVDSRRLGRSLGVDPVPFKTCTYDCVYCQLGETVRKTAETCDYAETGAIISELKEALGGAQADYITLSGSGEPTLNSGLGGIIREIKKLTSIPVCVLTNGSLLSRKEVRRMLGEADLVIPSLDASSAGAFELINRPHPSRRFSEMAEGIARFREEFKGRLCLEVMFVAGLNDSDEEISGFLPLIKRINPGAIQLNTVVRPPACMSACGVPADKLRRIRDIFGDRSEIIAPGKTAGAGTQSMAGVLKTLGRRPLSADDVSAGTGLNKNEAVKCLEALVNEGVIESIAAGGRIYYVIRRPQKGG